MADTAAMASVVAYVAAKGMVVMGGKPSKGTPADKRLSENKRTAPVKVPKR